MPDLACSECGQLAACTGLYRGARCAGDPEKCEHALSSCGDEIDDPKCADHCPHEYDAEHDVHCHPAAPSVRSVRSDLLAIDVGAGWYWLYGGAP